MKKILTLIMLVFAAFGLVACDEEKTPVENPTQGEATPEPTPEEPTPEEPTPEPTPEPVDDFYVVEEGINKEVKLSQTSNDAVKGLLNDLAVVSEEETSEEEVEQTVLSVVQMIELARLSDEQVKSFCDLAKQNKELLIKVVAGEEVPTVAEVEQLVNLTKDALEIIGEDALGLFLYNYQALSGAQIAGITVNTYVIEGRLIVKMLSSILNTIDSKDIETIYNMAFSQEPTASDIAKFVDILEEAVKSINYDNKVWEGYFAAVSDDTKRLLTSEEFKSLLESMEVEMGLLPMMLITASVGLVDSMTKLTPASIQLVENVLGLLDESVISELMVQIDAEWDGYYDEELEEWIENNKYYVDGKEVTEEEYGKAEFKQIKVVINLVYSAYKKLNEEDKKALIASIEEFIVQFETAMIEMLKEQMPGEDIEILKYTGETATLDEVFAELDKFLLCESLEEANDGEDLYIKLIGYIATKAPVLVGAMFGGMQ